MIVHLLRVNENGIAKWWMASPDCDDVIKGKSDWSQAKMLMLWKRFNGAVTKIISYDHKFSMSEASATIVDIQEGRV